MSVRVTFLGAGDAFNSRARCHASYLVSASSGRFLMDCGPTILLALNRAEVRASSIDTVFISHLHGDHFAGLPFLFLQATFEDPRDRVLNVVGPPGLTQRVQDLYRALYNELALRKKPFDVNFVEVDPGERRRFDGVEMLPFRVPHQERDISLGMRVEVDGKSILYSGDTGWTEDLVEQSQGTDLFICECCYFETRVCFHLDYPRIAENADRFGCRRMILTHIGREVHERREEIGHEIAHDGMVVEL